MAKERAQFFSQAEQELLLEGYREFQTLIKTPGNTANAAKVRREGWEKVANKLNVASSGPMRTWEQVKVKYKNILQNATKKKAEQKKTGDGPGPSPFTPAEELALGFSINRPIVDVIPGGSTSLHPQPETSSSTTFISVRNNAPKLLPVPPQVMAEACVDSEETLSDECPEELPLPESPPPERSTDGAPERPTERDPVDSTHRSETESDIRFLYRRNLQLKNDYLVLMKRRVEAQIEVDHLKKQKLSLEIQLLQKELDSKI